MLLNCGVGEDCWEFLGLATRWNQLILKEINPLYSLEGLMLKLQYFGHLMRRANLLEKTLMLGERRQEKKGTTEDKMVGWHHQLRGHEFEQASANGERQGSLVCCSPWSWKESDMAERLNNSNSFLTVPLFSLHPLSPLIDDCLNLIFGSQGSSGGWNPLSNKHWGTQNGFFAQEPLRVHLGFTCCTFVPLSISPTPNLQPPPSPLVTTVLLSDFMNLAF